MAAKRALTFSVLLYYFTKKMNHILLVYMKNLDKISPLFFFCPFKFLGASVQLMHEMHFEKS